MAGYVVGVTARWESGHTFEFDTEAEAQAFSDVVNAGGGDGLDAIVAAGDVTSQVAELVDYSAESPRPNVRGF